MTSERNLEKTEHIYDCIIVGGGISGISFAHKMKSTGADILVIEKENTVGGCIHSHSYETNSDFWAELGAHTCYNSYIQLLSLASDLKMDDKVIPMDKCPYVLYSNDKIKNVMQELSLLSLFIHGPRIFFSSRIGKTAKEYFRSIVGGRNYDKLFAKLFRAVLSQNADDYPAEMFLKSRNGRAKHISRRFSFKGGIQSLLNAIIDKGNIPTQLSLEVATIYKREEGLYSITTSREKIFHAKNVAFAISPQHVSTLIKDIEPQVADYLQTIKSFHSQTLNILIHKADADLKKVAGIIPLSDEFLSVVSRDTIEHPEYRSFSFHFFADKTEAEMLACVSNALNIKKEAIIEHSLVSHTLPTIKMEHVNIAEKIDAARHSDNLFLLGNYFYGLSLEDCVQRSFDEFERYKKLTIGQ